MDEGHVYQLALSRAVEALGVDVVSHTVTFGLYAGRHTVFYGVRV